MSNANQTVLNNTQIQHLVKLGETFCIKAEDGEWEVESGTYKAIKKAVIYTQAEICKQSRQRRKTMSIGTNVSQERRVLVAKENVKDMKSETKG